MLSGVQRGGSHRETTQQLPGAGTTVRHADDVVEDEFNRVKQQDNRGTRASLPGGSIVSGWRSGCVHLWLNVCG